MIVLTPALSVLRPKILRQPESAPAHLMSPLRQLWFVNSGGVCGRASSELRGTAGSQGTVIGGQVIFASEDSQLRGELQLAMQVMGVKDFSCSSYLRTC